MAEPDWAKVLQFLYENDGRYRVARDDNSVSRKEQKKKLHSKALKEHLPKKAGLDADTDQQVQNVLEHLYNVKLIERHSEETRHLIKLTPDGFEVAHERELAKRQDRTNTTLVGFTLALVLASLVAVLPSALPFLGYDFNLRLVGAIVLVEVVVWYILHTDLHEDLLDL